MNTKLVFGYVLGILGLILVFWSAYAYLADSELLKVPTGAGLSFLSIGAIMIKKNKNIPQ